MLNKDSLAALLMLAGVVALCVWLVNNWPG